MKIFRGLPQTFPHRFLFSGNPARRSSKAFFRNSFENSFGYCFEVMILLLQKAFILRLNLVKKHLQKLISSSERVETMLIRDHQRPAKSNGKNSFPIFPSHKSGLHHFAALPNTCFTRVDILTWLFRNVQPVSMVTIHRRHPHRRAAALTSTSLAITFKHLSSAHTFAVTTTSSRRIYLLLQVGAFSRETIFKVPHPKIDK